MTASEHNGKIRMRCRNKTCAKLRKAQSAEAAAAQSAAVLAPRMVGENIEAEDIEEAAAAKEALEASNHLLREATAEVKKLQSKVQKLEEEKKAHYLSHSSFADRVTEERLDALKIKHAAELSKVRHSLTHTHTHTLTSVILRCAPIVHNSFAKHWRLPLRRHRLLRLCLIRL